VAGRGAKITQALVARGIGFQIARIWPDDRRFERKLKNRKNAPKLCPICQAARRAPASQLTLDLTDEDLL
jgi:hypothetical protein